MTTWNIQVAKPTGTGSYGAPVNTGLVFDDTVALKGWCPYGLTAVDRVRRLVGLMEEDDNLGWKYYAYDGVSTTVASYLAGGAIKVEGVPFVDGAIPSGEILLWAGHSYIARNQQVFNPVENGTDAISTQAHGMMAWCRNLTQRANMDSFGNYNNIQPWQSKAASTNVDGANQGVSGDLFGPTPNTPTQPGLIARLPRILLSRPKAMVIDMGINEILSRIPVPIGVMQSQALWVYDQCMKAGCKVIVVAIPSTQAMAGLGNPAEAYRKQYNSWNKALQSSRNGFYFADITTVTGDSPATQDLTLFSRGADGSYLHPNDVGAFRIANEVMVPLINTLYAAGDCYDTDPTNGSIINYFPNAAMSGTGGTATGVTGGGTAPDNYTTAIVQGTSQYTLTQGTRSLTIGLTPQANAGVQGRFSLKQNAAGTLSALGGGAGLAPGDYIRMIQKISTTGVDWNQIRTLAAQTGVAPTFARASQLMTADSSAVTNRMLAGNMSAIFISDPIQIPAGATTLPINGTETVLSARFDDGGAPMSITISDPVLRKLAVSPLVTWNRPSD